MEINLKFEKSFPLICRDRRDKSIDVASYVQHQTFKIKTKFRYSFEDRGTDGQTELKICKKLSLVCRACQNESIDIQHIALWSIFTPTISSNIFCFFGH